MKIPQLDSCCCGCSLETGSKIIAWSELVGCMLMIIMLGYAEAALGEVNTSDNHVDPNVVKAVQILTIIAIIIFAVVGIFSLLLLVGVYKRNPNFLKLWLIVSTVALLLDIVTLIVKLFQAHETATAVFGELISMAINVYFLLVIYSYYRVLTGTHSVYST